MNVELLILAEGGSAHGQPADQIHNLVHLNNKLYQKLLLQDYDNIYLRATPRRTTAGNLAGVSHAESIAGEVWAHRRIHQYMGLFAWVNTGYLSESDASVTCMKRFGMVLRDIQCAWKLFKKQQDLLSEDLIDIKVEPTNRDGNVRPRGDERTSVYQVAVPSASGQVFWRSLHSGLQKALKREVARRQVQKEHQVHLKISDKVLNQRAQIQLWFLGLSPVSMERLAYLSKHRGQHATVWNDLRCYSIDLDKLTFRFTSTGTWFELRKVSRLLAEPLHQNEPGDLPDGDAQADALSALYGLSSGGVMFEEMDGHPGSSTGDGEPGGVGGRSSSNECFEDPDGPAAGSDDDGDGGRDGGNAAPPREAELRRLEAVEEAAMRELHLRRREARVCTKGTDFKKMGWIELNGVWMFPLIVNKE